MEGYRVVLHGGAEAVLCFGTRDTSVVYELRHHLICIAVPWHAYLRLTLQMLYQLYKTEF